MKPSGYFAVTVANRWNIHWDRWLKRALKDGATDIGSGYNYSHQELKRHIEQKTKFETLQFLSDSRLPNRVLPVDFVDNVLSGALEYLGGRITCLARRK